MAALGSKMAQLQSKAFETATLAAKHGYAYQQQVKAKAVEAATLAAKHGSAYQQQLQSKAVEAGRLAAEHASQLPSKACEATRLAAEHASQLPSKACETTRFVAKQGSAYHRSLMERNKEYVVDPPTVEKCRELSRQLFYTRLASLPGRYESFWNEVDGVKLLLKNRKNLKIEDLGVAALFGIELYAWLCTGEIVGRGFTLTGYHV